MRTDFISPSPINMTQKSSAAPSNLRAAAEELEAIFLAEMLKSAGLGKSREGFGGGAGEAQFASLLVTEQARAMARSGGIGLAEQIFAALQTQGRGNDR